MEAEIIDIIKKNLPQHVGEILKNRLEEAEKDSKRLILLEEEINKLENEIKLKNTRLTEYEKLDERNKNLNKKEEDINKKIHDLDLEILRVKLSTEMDKSEFIKSVTLGLVRNTEYRKNAFNNELISNTDPNCRNSTSSITRNNLLTESID